jgi:DNA-binding transcriptional MerR regulator
VNNKWTLPGTVIDLDRGEASRVDKIFGSMFLTGGMTLSQVCNLTGLEAYMVQNWVKRGFLTPPRQKHYDKEQLCRIININMLRGILPMERICSLLSYVNGKLDDQSDDIIDDSQLYFLFVRLASRAKELDDPAAWEQAMEEALAQYQEPVPGARSRIEKALRVMLTAWVAARMRHAAETMLQEL